VKSNGLISKCHLPRSLSYAIWDGAVERTRTSTSFRVHAMLKSPLVEVVPVERAVMLLIFHIRGVAACVSTQPISPLQLSDYEGRSTAKKNEMPLAGSGGLRMWTTVP
jgi:hypothetical protein